MNNQLIIELEQAPIEKPPGSTSQQDAVPPQLKALGRVVDQVKADAQQQPRKYLNSAIVPAGGE